MIGRARLLPGPGFQPLHLLRYGVMRAIPHELTRRMLARVIAAYVSLRRGRPATSSAHEEMFGAAKRLAADGCTTLNPVLSPSQIDDVLAFLKDELVIGTRDQRFSAERPPADATRASYPLETIMACPHLVELINSPAILELAGAYLGCAPTISSIGIHWSFPSAIGTPDVVQKFHRDPDDWRFFKLFVYLSDVDETSGPHEYVLGSHRTSGTLRGGSYGDAEVNRQYGGDKLTHVTGPRGTTFLADTWGIHKGGVPVSKPRLIFQVQYSILPIYRLDYGQRIRSRTAAIDKYASRLLLA